MKTLHHDRNTARPLGATGTLSEVIGSVLSGSIIAPGPGGRFLPRLPSAADRGAMIRFC